MCGPLIESGLKIVNFLVLAILTILAVAPRHCRADSAINRADTTLTRLYDTLYKRIKNIQRGLAGSYNRITCTLNKYAEGAAYTAAKRKLAAGCGAATPAAATIHLAAALALLAAFLTILATALTVLAAGLAVLTGSNGHLLLCCLHFNSSAGVAPIMLRSCLNNACDSSRCSGKYPKLSLLSRITSK